MTLSTTEKLGEPVFFESAVSVAASLVIAMQSKESLLDLLFVGKKAYCFTTGRQLSNMDQMLEILAAVDVCKDFEIDSLTPLVLQRVSLLSACICVFLTWDTSRKKLIRQLRNLGLPVKVIVITRPENESETDSQKKSELSEASEGAAETVSDDESSPEEPDPMIELPDQFHCIPWDGIEQGLAKL